MKRVLCKVLGHKLPGRRFMIGPAAHKCTRCGTTVWKKI